MAFEVLGPSDVVPRQASANVSALTYSGNPPLYASGGIPYGVGVIQDTSSGLVGDVTLPAAQGASIAGVAQAYPAAGTNDSVPVAIRGIVKAKAASAIAIGDLIEVADNTGRFQTARSATATFAVGIALTAAAAANDYFSLQLMLPAGKVTTP